MENATKALLIAGAILISILVIAIGMFIYNGSQSAINSGMSQLSNQEIEAFNQQWNSYVGQQSGSNVSSLVAKLISNAASNQDEESKLVGLSLEATSGDAPLTAEPVLGDLKTSDFQDAKKAIQLRHTYTVSLEYDGTSGLVNKVVVEY